MRQVGATHSVKRGPDDAKTLAELQFSAGDYLDVAVMTGHAEPRGEGL